MPTPHIPSGFKPVAAGYSIGAPDGVLLSEVAGGMPRPGRTWSRGKQVIQLGMVLGDEKFFVWTVWFQRVIFNGALQFLMPLDTGMGMQDHLCMIVPGTYSAAPLSGKKAWSITFSVVTESSAYAISDEDVSQFVELWEAAGDDMSELLEAIARFATEDTLVLQP